MNPELEEPKKAEMVEEQPEAKAQALLAELEKAGYTTPEEVAGALKASKEVGTMARHLGSSRSENESLKQELAMLRQAIESQGARQPQADSESLDLATLIENSVRNVYKKDILEPQMRAQQQFHAEMEEVTQDPDFPLVKDAFTTHLYSPSTQSRLLRGETTVTKEYNKVIRTAMRAMLGETAKTLKGMTNKPAAPFVESADETTGKDTSGSVDLSKLQAAHQKGAINSDQLLDAIVKKSLFGNPDDPKR